MSAVLPVKVGRFSYLANLETIPELGKRRHVKNSKECKIELGSILLRIFSAFDKSVRLYNKEIVFTPVGSRGRGFEANYLNSKIIQCIQEEFPDNWYFGKYKRFILRIGGYLILFKKLNRLNFPMNVPTKNTLAINNQSMNSLFDDQADLYEPIVYFGYRKDVLDSLFDPKLVYIDEGKIGFAITENDLIEEIIADDRAYLEPNLVTPMAIKPEARRRRADVCDS